MINTQFLLRYKLVWVKYSGGWLNMKIPSNQYRKSHCGDKTILRSSYLHNGISYTGKMISLYWIRAQMTSIIIGVMLTPLVLTLKYCGIYKSLPWLVMPWLLSLPGHQQLWCLLWRINGSSVFQGRDFNFLGEMQIKYCVLKMYSPCKGLKDTFIYAQLLNNWSVCIWTITYIAFSDGKSKK